MALTKRQPPANATMGGTRVTSWGLATGELVGNPGEWFEVATKPNRTAAVQLANSIASGKKEGFVPAGAFKSAWAEEDGAFPVYAMYVGASANGSEPSDTEWGAARSQLAARGDEDED